MRVFDEIMKKNIMMLFELLPCLYFVHSHIANAISRKVLVLEARNLCQLIEC